MTGTGKLRDPLWRKLWEAKCAAWQAFLASPEFRRAPGPLHAAWRTAEQIYNDYVAEQYPRRQPR